MKNTFTKLAVLSLSFFAALGGQAGVVGQTYSGVRQVEKMAMRADVNPDDSIDVQRLYDLNKITFTTVSASGDSVVAMDFDMTGKSSGTYSCKNVLHVSSGKWYLFISKKSLGLSSNDKITNVKQDFYNGAYQTSFYCMTGVTLTLSSDTAHGPSNNSGYESNFRSSHPANSIVEKYAVSDSPFPERPVMKDGESRDIYYSVDAKTSQESIVAGVSAEDLFGVDVPVTVKTSDYVVGKIGIYHIVLTATDSYGQTSTATLVVHVVDRTAPVIQLKSSVNVPYSSQFTEADMKSHLTVKDNVSGDEDLAYTWQLPSGFTWGSAFGVKGVGKQSFGLTVTDASGNKSSATIQVTVIDNIPPVISRKDGAATTTAIAYGYSKSRTLTLSALLDLFKGKDDVDGDNLAVYRKSGEFDSSIGSHSIVIACKDSAGNESTMTLNYRIQADIPPVFILSDAIIGVTADIKLDVQDLKTLIATMNTSSNASASGKIRAMKRRAEGADVHWGSEGKTDIVINQQDLDAYEAGFDKVGEVYQIRYTYTDTKTAQTGLEGTVYIRVMDAPKAGEFEDLTGWDGFVHWWKNFWKGFVEFFTVKIPEFFNRLKNWLTFRGWKTDAEIEAEKKAEQEEKSSSEVILQ